MKPHKTPAMKRIMQSLTLLVLCTSVFTQAPQGFNYQAVARDVSGNILTDAPLSVKIGILSGSATGTLVWEEVHLDTTSSLGLFTLNIGDLLATNTGGTAATFDAIVWGSASHFMKVEVDAGSGYADMGTTQLLSVPYALYAETGNEGPQGPTGPAGEQGPQGEPGDPATDDQDLSILGHELSISGGNSVTLPDSVIDNDADPANELQFVSFTNDTLYLSNGGYAYLGVYTDTQNLVINDYYLGITGGNEVELPSVWERFDKDISYDSGKVRINNLNGQVQLELTDVYGAGGRNLIIGDDSYLSDVDETNTLGILGLTDSTTASIRLGAEGPLFTGKNGNLGIGTTGPETKLHISGTESIGGGPGFVGLLLDSDFGENYTQQMFKVNGDYRALLEADTDGLFSIWTKGTGAHVQAMSIDADGNVGIGTTDQYRKLHLFDASHNVVLIESSGGESALNLKAGGSGGDWFINANDNINELRFNDGGTIHMVIRGSGNVGIGAISPSTKLDVDGVITATGGDSDEWNAAHGWGDHSTEGYLTAYTETDPVFGASAAAGISASDITEWNKPDVQKTQVVATASSTTTITGLAFDSSSSGILKVDVSGASSGLYSIIGTDQIIWIAGSEFGYYIGHSTYNIYYNGFNLVIENLDASDRTVLITYLGGLF